MQGKESFAEPKFAAIRCPKCGLELDRGMAVCPNDGFEVLTVPRVGTVFENEYEFISRLAAGGMGVIFKARQRGLDRAVAIKMLQTANATDVSVQRFQQEAQAMARLDHPNLVKVYGLSTTDYGQPYMVMEYIDGKGLDAVLKERGQLTLLQFFNVFLQVCDGLQYVHDAGILHRDLKPSNIMICSSADNNPPVKLVDFGIAKISDTSAAKHLTQTGEVFGSPLYMSPEQAKGAGADERSDIYALGCVMYETLTGIAPFAGTTVVEVIMKQVGEKHRPLNSVVRGQKYPNALEALIDKMLEKDPVKRFQSVDQLKIELQKLAVEHRPWYHLAVPGILVERKKESAVIWSLICFVALSLCGFVAYFSVSNLQQKNPMAPTAFDSAADVVHHRADPQSKQPVGPESDDIRAIIKNMVADHGRRILFMPECCDRETYPLILDCLKRRTDRYVTEIDTIAKKNYIDDKIIPCIEDFPLRRLGLNHSFVTNVSIPAISRISTLEILEIDRLHLTANDCRMLLRLPALTELSVSEAKIDNQLLAILCRHKRLSRLHLNSAPITDAGIYSIVQSPAPISFLSVDRCSGLTDRSIEYLSTGMPELAELTMSTVPLTDKCLPFLERMHSLRCLGLVGTKLTNKGLSGFKAPGLSRLYVGGCGQLTIDGVRQFLKNNPKCVVQWSDQNYKRYWLSVGSNAATPAAWAEE